MSFRLFLFIFISIVIMVVDHRLPHLEVVRSLASNLLCPLQYVVNLPSQLTAWGHDTLAGRSQLLAENRHLRASLLHLRARQQKMAALQTENTRLRRLLGSGAQVPENMLLAEQMQVNTDPYKQQILIDKGSSDDVYIGQPLIDANGVVGQITHIAARTATALLISDTTHALPVRVVRNGLLSVIAGIGLVNEVALLHIQANADIQIGDMLVTSGLGGRFPADYPVARITTIEHPPGKSFARVRAKPIAQLDRLRQLLLVWPEKNPAPPASSSAAATMMQ